MDTHCAYCKFDAFLRSFDSDVSMQVFDSDVSMQVFDSDVSMQVFDSEEHAYINKRRYDPIFDVYRRMNNRKRRPKMEGVDVVVMDDDKERGQCVHQDGRSGRRRDG